MPLRQAGESGGEGDAHDEPRRGDEQDGEGDLDPQGQADERAGERGGGEGDEDNERGGGEAEDAEARVIALGEPAAPVAADAAEDEHREDDDGEGVSGVAEEKDELLDEADLHQDVAGAEAEEVGKEAADAGFGGEPATKEEGGAAGA